MVQKIQFKRGLSSRIPTLDIAEPGFCTDTQELYIGASTGNRKITSFNEISALESDTALLFGSSISNVTLATDGSGNVTGIQEKNGSTTLTNTSWTYNPDGTINTVTEVIGSQTIVSTFHYVNGSLDPTNAITRSVS